MSRLLLSYTIRCEYRVLLNNNPHDSTEQTRAIREAIEKSGLCDRIGVDPDSIRFTVEED